MKQSQGWTIALVAAALMMAFPGLAAATPKGGKPVAKNIYAFHVKSIDGADESLADYRGKTLLIVNTASECGNTPQYADLETLYQKYKARGFEVLAFPANNFGHQEPGTNSEIKTFCSTNYHTTFPLFSKISVKGDDIAPLYHYLTTESGHPGDIDWNFAKFLVAPDGRVVARFAASTKPLEPKVVEKIEATLAAGVQKSGAH